MNGDYPSRHDDAFSSTMRRFFSHFGLALQSIKKRGLINTFRHVLGEYWFDSRFRVNTKPLLLTEDPNLTAKDITTASPHYGTNWFLLKKIFTEKLPTIVGNFKPNHLIDYGSGAGRVLITALHFGLPKVTGVEFSKLLCHRANENLASFSNRHSDVRSSLWSVVNSDARVCPIPPDADLFFLYNPFGPPIIEQVAKNIYAHAQSYNGPITIIYVNPVHHAAFELAGFKKSPTSDKEVCFYTIGR